MAEKLTKREIEEMKEEWRANIKANVAKVTKANAASKVRRFVDKDVLDKTVIHQYARFKQSRAKAEYSDEAINKMKHTQTFDGNHLMVCDIPLNTPLEEVYLNKYGTGFDGRETPTAMHQAYICPKCGLKMLVDPAVMDLKCKRCGAQTPLGRLCEDKFWKKI